MATEAPRNMGFYMLIDKEMQKVAVFRWTEEGVTLEVLKEGGGPMAREYFTEGILSYRLGEFVTPSQPEEFMEALTEPRNMSYYAFRRED